MRCWYKCAGMDRDRWWSRALLVWSPANQSVDRTELIGSHAAVTSSLLPQRHGVQVSTKRVTSCRQRQQIMEGALCKQRSITAEVNDRSQQLAQVAFRAGYRSALFRYFISFHFISVLFSRKPGAITKLIYQAGVSWANSCCCTTTAVTDPISYSFLFISFDWLHFHWFYVYFYVSVNWPLVNIIKLGLRNRQILKFKRKCEHFIRIISSIYGIKYLQKKIEWNQM